MLALLVSALAASAAAIPTSTNSGNLTTYTRPLGPDLRTLDVSAPVKTVEDPGVDNNVFVTPEMECLSPAYRPVTEDCEALCQELAATGGGGVIVDPLNIFYMENGWCAVGFANLDACTSKGVVLADIAPWCFSMYDGCILNGYDGLVTDSDENIAMALTGLEAAPPYTEEPC